MATRVTTTGSFGFQNAQRRNYGNANEPAIKRIPMFHIKGLFAEFLNTKHNISGVILPAFDPSMEETDSARQLSVGSYRVDDGSYDADGNAYLSAWSVSMDSYVFYGNSMQNFISPKVIGRPDPIVDLRIDVYRRIKEGDESLRYLMTIPQNADWRDTKLALPNPQTMVYMNIWGTGSNAKAQDAGVVRNRILAVKGAVWQAVESDLNKERPASVAVARDAEWSQYLYGDITHPAHAVEFTSQVREFKSRNNSSYTSAALSFGNLVGNPAGGKLLQCKTVQIPEEALQGRFDITNCDTCFYIPTYDEIVQMLVDDGLVPHWLIKEVCVPNCKEPITFPGEGGAAQAASAAVAPVTAAPVAPVVAPVAAPVQAPVAAPAPAPVVAPAPTLAPAPAIVQSQGSLFQDDPDDDIPMGDAPAAGSLTAEEQAELQALFTKLNTNAGSMLPEDSIRLSQLLAKQCTK